MFRFKSIMSRIMFLHIVVVVGTAISLPLALSWFLDKDVKNLQQRDMSEQAKSIAQYLIAKPQNGWSLDLPAGLRDQYSEAYGRYLYAVVDEYDRVLFASRKDGAPLFQLSDPSSPMLFYETRRGDRTISGASLRKDMGGNVVWVQVAEDMAHSDVLIDDVVANFFRHVSWITVPILFLLFAIDILIFRRAVTPLLHASDRAAHISPTRIDLRLPTGEIPKEILPLVIAVNQAFDRLEQGFNRQREFASEAAHELRTPLAILRARTETLPDRGVADALRQDIESMSRVVLQLLDAAELETVIIDPKEKADLHAICAEVAEFIAPLALNQGKTVALSGLGVPNVVNGNEEMLRRAVRNLVENALRYTPEGTSVEIVVEEEGVVHVRDDGEGVPFANRGLIFQRFWRREHRSAGGAGLGLSIVKKIMDAHGGVVTVQNRPNGGAEFTLRFYPRSDAAALG